MEKRRRERINHSLETLRRLLLENTRNEVNSCLPFNVPNYLACVVTACHWNICSNIVYFLLFLEAKQPKGRKSRDSGERGWVFEDWAWGRTCESTNEEGSLCGGCRGVLMQAQEELPGGHEVMSPESQPLHQHQEPGTRRDHWYRHLCFRVSGSCNSSNSCAVVPICCHYFQPRPWSQNRAAFVPAPALSPQSGVSTQPKQSPRSVLANPEDWSQPQPQQQTESSTHGAQWHCVEALASVMTDSLSQPSAQFAIVSSEGEFERADTFAIKPSRNGEWLIGGKWK